jgi:hypothetical protein
VIDLTREKPLSVAEVQSRFGVGRTTVNEWFEAGLESVKVGHRRYTTLEAIQRFSKPVGERTASKDRKAVLKQAAAVHGIRI